MPDSDKSSLALQIEVSLEGYSPSSLAVGNLEYE